MSAKTFFFVIPGEITTQTGGYVYDRRLLQELRAQGKEVTHIALGSSFPNPTAADTGDAAKKLSVLPADCPVIIDGLALGALNPSLVAKLLGPLVALIHHPLAFEGGLAAERRDYLFQTERENLSKAARVVVTSSNTAKLLEAEYGVPPERITIARPGVDQKTNSTNRSKPPLILSVGIQVPRKGHDVLLEALADITDLPWQAVIVGPVLDPDYGAKLTLALDELGLRDRVQLAGQLSDDELSNLYSRASLFALATRFEGYGMVFGEAMAHGLPIVSCRTGAVPDTVPEGAGLLVPPGEPEAFATAVAKVLQDSDLRQRLAGASAAAGAKLIGWKETGARVGAVLDLLDTTGGRLAPLAKEGNDSD